MCINALLAGAAIGTVWGLSDNKKKAQAQGQTQSKAPSGLNASTWYPPEPAQAAQPQGRGTATRSPEPPLGAAGAPRGLANLSSGQFKHFFRNSAPGEIGGGK